MIKVENLVIKFGTAAAVDDVSFEINKGEIVGIVGESGSGKSLTVTAIMGLLAEEACVYNGKITINGCVTIDKEKSENISPKYVSESSLRELRGKVMTMIFQEPMTSLNPTLKVGRQAGEILKIHTKMGKDEIKKAVLASFESVGLKNSEKVYNSYPHELSGGMRQRVMIAMVLLTNPDYIIADEPTTALDVTVQKQICDLLVDINRNKKTSIIFITHDLNLARKICNRVIVMNNGKIVEEGETDKIFSNPQRDYTKKLIASTPKREKRRRAGNE